MLFHQYWMKLSCSIHTCRIHNFILWFFLKMDLFHTKFEYHYFSFLTTSAVPVDYTLKPSSLFLRVYKMNFFKSKDRSANVIARLCGGVLSDFDAPYWFILCGIHNISESFTLVAANCFHACEMMWNVTCYVKMNSGPYLQTESSVGCCSRPRMIDNSEWETLLSPN